jgi:phage tail sheath protein FI
MARLSYQAPGVYVEELHSARQPITGVGTNTAAFIGYIPSDELWYPVLNEDYDPVAARDLLEYNQLLAGGADAARLAELRAALASRKAIVDQQVTELDRISKAADERQTTRAAALRTAETARDALPKDTDTRAADTAVTNARRELSRATAAATEAKGKLEAAKRESNDLQRQIEGAPAGPGVRGAGDGGAPPPPADDGGEKEDYDYADIAPSDDLKIPSMFRPYYLKKFSLDTPEFDTKLCTNFTEYVNHFGSFSAFAAKPDNPNDKPGEWRYKPLHPGHHYLTHAVSGFFANGGTKVFVTRIKQVDEESLRKVLSRLSSIDDVAILAAPGLPKMTDVWEPLMDYVEDDAHQNVFAILDSPAVVSDPDEVTHTSQSSEFDVTLFDYKNPNNIMPRASDHSAYYFPWIEVSDSAKHMQDADPSRGIPAKRRGRTYVPPSGHMAGVYARTDEERGVYKAPANAVLRGALDVKYHVSKPMQELMNPQGANCIRIMNNAVTIWGARTVGGDVNGEWKYINVRRFAGFLEASLDRGTQWVVFEPNDPALWSKIILNITAFLTNVWRSGALFGLTAQEAFYVKCDEELNPPEVRDLGQVVTEIGVSIVRPAEFVIFRIAQSTAQTKS